MKKIVILMVCMVFNNVVNAQTIMITAEDAGAGRLRIGYEITEGTMLPVGFGLDISLSNGATFQSLVSASLSFPIYPGSIAIDGTGVITDLGSPIVAGSLGTSAATIEMGIPLSPEIVGTEPPNARDLNSDGIIDLLDMALFADDWIESSGLISDLYADGFVNFTDYSIFTQGDPLVATSGDLLLLQLDGNGAESTLISITENGLRSGIVGDDIDFDFNVILPGAVSVVVPEPATLLLLGMGYLALRKKSKT